jgi:hypothetical protein
MGVIPTNVRWFLADFVVEFRIEDDPRNAVHVTTVLIRADSAEEAYSRALELGRGEYHRYRNDDGKVVEARFRGLGDLQPIREELEHGAELVYTEKVGLSPEAVLGLVRPKAELSAFREPSRSDGPNY